MNGRFFQITPKGKIVWEYVSPYAAQTPVGSTAAAGGKQLGLSRPAGAL